jgi:hypothetical protein
MSPIAENLVGKAANVLGLNVPATPIASQKTSFLDINIDILSKRSKSRAGASNDSSVELLSSRPEDRLLSWNHLSSRVDTIEYKPSVFQRASSMRMKRMSASYTGEECSHSKSLRRRSSLSTHELKL